MQYITLLVLVLSTSCALKTTHQINTDKKAEAVLEHYRNNLNTVKSCYMPILQKSPELGGQMILEWTVDDRGQVIQSQVTEKTFESPAIEACLSSHLKTLTFPQAPKFSKISVAYTFKFKRE